MAFIRETWSKIFPDELFEYNFLDTNLARLYEAEEKMQRIFTLFSILSIIIACLGLLGLATFTAEERTKEIGIRKVLGASSGQIVSSLMMEFAKWVILANLVAWPIAWIAMKGWLQNFAYRTDIGWWVFFVAGAAALVIALPDGQFPGHPCSDGESG